jgi:phosphoglycerate dehydrogenase-like enzyme
MTGILLSPKTFAAYRDPLAAAARAGGIEARVVHLPDDPEARLSPDAAARIEIAYFTRDIRFSDHYQAFVDTVTAAPNLKWVHFPNAGVDQHPFLPALAARKVRLTTSAGSNGEPVGQTAIAGLLLLARNFPHWWASQQKREWAPIRGAAVPRDLSSQTVLVIGMGTVGSTVARFCRALGMHVIGVRRKPRSPEDPVDEMHAIDALPQLLPRCDWVVLACSLTPGTRRVINASTLALLPRGARLVNVCRGAVVDEPAVIEALKSGQLGGAYLDVFEQEPLAPDSPLWALPNVIVSPHNAQASAGNDARAMQIFLDNLPKWARGEPLRNEQLPS